MNIRILTHTDLDGISCSLLIKKLFCNSDDEIITTYTNYDKIEENLTEIEEEILSFDCNISILFVTDLSFNQNQVERLKNINDNYIKVVYIDHHNTTFNSKEDFQILSTEHSATKLLYNYLINQGGNIVQYLENYIKIYNDRMKEYVNAVSLWDTFQWKDNPESKESKLAVSLDRCFKYMGGKEFLKKILCLEFDKMKNGFELPSFMKFISDIEEEKIKKLCEFKNKYLKIFNKDCYKVGFVTAENYESYIADYILYNNDIDYVMIYKTDTKNVSLRSRNDSDIDVSEIAKKYGGGGHVHAAGFNMDAADDYNLKMDIRDLLV